LHKKPLNLFNKDYYECGVEKKISAYENYRWIPERSIREAISLNNLIDFEKVLDYGCAKGFLVHALRLLDKKSFGVDISSYAIKNCMPQAKPFLKHIRSYKDIKFFEKKENRKKKLFDLIIAKDVLEHIQKQELIKTLNYFSKITKKVFFVVPLGDGKKYRIREYEMDKTHIIRETEEWWINVISSNGFKIKYFDYNFLYIKDHWTKAHPYGNAFIVGECKI
jgi:predicted TPR repeat methyltransferase